MAASFVQSNSYFKSGSDNTWTTAFTSSVTSGNLIVVAVGGLGSLKGTLVAALVIGVFDTGGKYLLSDAGGFFVYAVTVAVLLIKPAGFYGRE